MDPRSAELALGTELGKRGAQVGLADEITAVFCGSKKSLANGVPMAKILFAGNPALGLIVLPIMIYHQLQLIVCSTLARKYADRVAHAERAADTGAGQPA